MNDFTFHKVSTFFPAMTDHELMKLSEDIKENGQYEPILVLGKEIIDGRNRYKACLMAGVEPVFREYEGEADQENLTKAAIALNLKRRHLSQAQKAVLGVQLYALLKEAAIEKKRMGGEMQKGNLIPGALYGDVEKIPQAGSGPEDIDVIDKKNEVSAKIPRNDTTRKQVASILGVNEKYVGDVGKISDEAPELLPEILENRITLTEAKRKLNEILKKRPDYIPVPPTKTYLEITIPVSAQIERAALIDALKISEEKHPGAIQVVTKHGGKAMTIEVVKR